MWVEAYLSCGAEVAENLICVFLMSWSALGDGAFMRNRWRAEGCSSLRHVSDKTRTIARLGDLTWLMWTAATCATQTDE